MGFACREGPSQPWVVSGRADVHWKPIALSSEHVGAHVCCMEEHGPGCLGSYFQESPPLTAGCGIPDSDRWGIYSSKNATKWQQLHVRNTRCGCALRSLPRLD